MMKERKKERKLKGECVKVELTQINSFFASLEVYFF